MSKKIDPISHIIVKGARVHNLQNIDLNIPKHKFVVFSGLSGSGKSSLAFDTLYAEGQRRYVESLSSYARQFLGIMDKPEVDQIEGLSPAISIDQKTTSHNPRSTVGTITEIYDYLRLLFARIGHPHCPKCGQEISRQSIDQIVDQVLEKLQNKTAEKPSRILILSPVVQNRKGEFSGLLETLQHKGYKRARIDKSIYQIHESLSLLKNNKHTIETVVDRLSISKTQLKDDKEKRRIRSRLNQSIEESLELADGIVVVSFIEDDTFDFPEKPKKFEDFLFSEKLACSECGISLKELSPRMFSFNSPEGACPKCNGIGSIPQINEKKIIAPILTLSEGAIIPFARVLSYDTWWSRLVKVVVKDQGYDFRETAWEDYDEETKDLLLHGNNEVYKVVGTNRHGKETVTHQKFEGFVTNLERRYEETKSNHQRKEIEKFMVKQKCPVCHGARLKEKVLSVFINNKNIADVSQLTIQRSYQWIKILYEDTEELLTKKESLIGHPILKEIRNRLKFLTSVGLDYLTLSREAGSLAGGEAQRIRLASQIGTGLTGVLYILDEPTIGLHQRDNHRLIKTLKDLKNKGNTVIVVEHDKDILLAADHVIDFGPKAGKKGGKVVVQGSPDEIMADQKSITGKYLSGKKDIKRKKKKREIIGPDEVKLNTKNQSGIIMRGATHHNLKSIDIKFPLNSLICITGVSGSGKSTLLHDTLYYHLLRKLDRKLDRQPGPVKKIIIPDQVQRVSLIDQRPIGKTPRSNPATYTKVFDYIRKKFANTKKAKIRGYKPGRFSFNVKGGRCEACKGDGQIKIEMQFLADVYVTCDVCHGKRYNDETLQVKYKGKSIADVLDMNVEEAYGFFKTNSTLRKKLKTLIDVGLGYIELGQPAPTLSGGEAQRIKLAKELSTRSYNHIVYLLDEPTTGLHFADIQKLLNVLNRLVAQGNTVILIEHNLDIIKNADWIIDLGPEGGENGGEVVGTGTPEQIMQNSDSYTGHYLKQEINS